MSFDKYIGREVRVLHSVVEREIGTLGRLKFDEYDLDETDPTLMEIRADYPGVRIFTPGAMGTCDYVVTRLNVYITGNEDKTVFKISRVNFG